MILTTKIDLYTLLPMNSRIPRDEFSFISLGITMERGKQIVKALQETKLNYPDEEILVTHIAEITPESDKEHAYGSIKKIFYWLLYVEGMVACYSGLCNDCNTSETEFHNSSNETWNKCPSCGKSNITKVIRFWWPHHQPCPHPHKQRRKEDND